MEYQFPTILKSVKGDVEQTISPTAMASDSEPAEPASQPAPPAQSSSAAAAADPPLPIKFKDAVGRKFAFPFELVKTWGVCSPDTEANY